MTDKISEFIKAEMAETSGPQLGRADTKVVLGVLCRLLADMNSQLDAQYESHLALCRQHTALVKRVKVLYTLLSKREQRWFDDAMKADPLIAGINQEAERYGDPIVSDRTNPGIIGPDGEVHPAPSVTDPATGKKHRIHGQT